jgi:hypothetical protein
MKIISSEVENCFGCSFCERGHGKYLCDKLGRVEISNPARVILDNCPLPDSTAFVSRELFDRAVEQYRMIVNGWVQSDVIKKVHDKRIKALRAEANGKKVVK